MASPSRWLRGEQGIARVDTWGDGTEHLRGTPCLCLPCRVRAQVAVPGGGLPRAQTGTEVARAPPWSTAGAAAEASLAVPAPRGGPGHTPPAWAGPLASQRWTPLAPAVGGGQGSPLFAGL